MENLEVQERKANRKAQIKKKPMKVVYISNPMKFKANTASEFRALVQELTGQDAEFPHPTKVWDTEDDGAGGGGHHRTVPDASKAAAAADDHHHHDALDVSTVVVDPSGKEQPADVVNGPLLLNQCVDDDDDVFMPQMLENFSGLMPSSLFFESTTHVDVIRGL